MSHRNRRGGRAKLAVAAAVLVGGGAAAVGVLASSHGASETLSNSAFQVRQTYGESKAVTSALASWSHSRTDSLSDLARMRPVHTFTQFEQHRTTFAAQRGVVELATKDFLLVKSADGGGLHIWWLNGHTKFDNVTANATGLIGLTGSTSAAKQAILTGNMRPAETAVAGSTAMVKAMAAPTKTTTVSIVSGDVTVNITISHDKATVTAPGTTSPSPSASATVSASPSATATVSASATPTTTATQPVTTTTNGVAAGDLVFIAGERVHGKLVAQLVLFAAPTTTVTPTPTPSASVSVSTSATATTSPTVTATPTTTVAPTPTSTAPVVTPTVVPSNLQPTHE